MGISIVSAANPPTAVQSVAEPPNPTPNLKTPVNPPLESKKPELSQILKAVAKDRGDRVVVMGDKIPLIERIPTGIFEFDLATGGGFPKGRLSIIYGPESSCKTNVVLKAMATVQRYPPTQANKVVFVNLEQTFDPTWSAHFGVDDSELVVVNAGYGEEAVDIIEAVVRAEDVGMVVVDSIAVLTAAREVQASTDKQDVGTAAILVKRLCNKLAIALSEEARREHYPAVIFVNQTRFKIGVMFGDPETMPGGQTMKFMSSLTVRVSGKDIMLKDVHPALPVFKEVSAIIRKAKVGVLQKAFEFKMCMYPHNTLGIGETSSWNFVSSSLKESGVISKQGTKWVLYGNQYKTLGEIEALYVSDIELQLRLQSEVIQWFRPKHFLVESSNG